MIYDERKGKGVKEKGNTCHKVFINKEASYTSVLERMKCMRQLKMKVNTFHLSYISFKTNPVDKL